MTVILALLIVLAPAPFWRDRSSGGPAGVWVSQSGAVRVTFSTDGTYRELWHDDTTYVGSWSLRGGRLTAICKSSDHDRYVYRLRFSRCGRTLLVHGFDVTLHREGDIR